MTSFIFWVKLWTKGPFLHRDDGTSVLWARLCCVAEFKVYTGCPPLAPAPAKKARKSKCTLSKEFFCRKSLKEAFLGIFSHLLPLALLTVQVPLADYKFV